MKNSKLLIQNENVTLFKLTMLNVSKNDNKVIGKFLILTYI